MSKSNKNNKKEIESNDEFHVSRKTKIMSLILLGIMVFSILGFAFISSDGNFGKSSTEGGNLNVELQADLFQNSQTGEKYWGAIKNGERFIFTNGIEGFQFREDMQELANNIKSKNFVNIYVAENYVSSDSVYLVEKALNGLQIANARIVGNVSCNLDTIAFVLENSTLGDGCLKFSAPQGEEYYQSEALAYYLIK